MNPKRKQPSSWYGLLLVILVLSLVVGLPMGRAQEGKPGLDPYPALDVELPAEAVALSGSATVTASLPVAVVTTHSRNASDGAMSSTAIHK